MPVNYYPNGTEEELLAMLEAIQRRGTTGNVSYVTLPGGGQTMLSLQNSAHCDITARRLLYALHKINPNDYENPYAARVRITRPYYVCS
jgi:hypothetical protein